MIKSNYQVLGVMSGTSLDGIDLAYCHFEVSAQNHWGFSIETAETIPYPEHWRTILKDAIHYSEGRLNTLNEKYTHYLSNVILAFLQRHDLTEIDAVCSHGHTILHQPEKGMTLQIGNLSLLSKKVCQTVVCDFRVQDVQLGGQGAPLVPIGDRLLFRDYDYCLNLGGFANVSFERNGARIAYDVCPINIVLNYYASQLGFDYDPEGSLAASGKVLPKLLEQLNALPYYGEIPPKSLGLEWVKDYIFPILQKTKEPPKDLLCTFTEHAAQQLVTQFPQNAKVLVTGGGAYNKYLLERMAALQNLDLEIPSSQLIDYKEALVFGLLGVLNLREEVNCLASVTGAVRDHSSGNLFQP